LLGGKRDKLGDTVLEGGDGRPIAFGVVQVVEANRGVVVGERFAILVPTAPPMFEGKEKTLFEGHGIQDVPALAGV
jgi:hypothetical protein